MTKPNCRFVWLLPWIVLLALAAGACGLQSTEEIALGTDTSASSDFAFPVLDEALWPPDTALPNGFEVAEGSWLLGTVFPKHIDTTSVSSGVFGPKETEHKEWYDWRALLVLTGSTRDVTDRYAKQAHELGYRSESAGVRCDSGSRLESCGFRARQDKSSTERPIWFTASALRAPDSKSNWPTAYVQLKVTGAGNTQKPEPIPGVNPVSSRPAERTPPSSSSGELTGAGEPFTDLQFELDGEPLGPRIQLEVEEGSALVAPPTYDLGGRQSEFFAVLEFPTNARALMTAYTEQARASYPADTGSESWEWGDTVVIESDRMCRGPCGIYRAKAVIGPDDSGYMLIRLMLRPNKSP